MPVDTPKDQFRVERHGEIAVVFPSPKVEELHEALMDQAAFLEKALFVAA